MAKSLRSKVKQSFRMKKRQTGVYAAADAARLLRLNSKLVQATKTSSDGVVLEGDDGGEEDIDQSMDTHQDTNDDESGGISTHGPRGSRREEWRKSKGLPARPDSKGINRQGVLSGRRKAGRSKRRR